MSYSYSLEFRLLVAIICKIAWMIVGIINNDGVMNIKKNSSIIFRLIVSVFLINLSIPKLKTKTNDAKRIAPIILKKTNLNILFCTNLFQIISCTLLMKCECCAIKNCAKLWAVQTEGRLIINASLLLFNYSKLFSKIFFKFSFQYLHFSLQNIFIGIRHIVNELFQ